MSGRLSGVTSGRPVAPITAMMQVWRVLLERRHVDRHQNEGAYFRSRRGRSEGRLLTRSGALRAMMPFCTIRPSSPDDQRYRDGRDKQSLSLEALTAGLGPSDYIPQFAHQQKLFCRYSLPNALGNAVANRLVDISPILEGAR